METGELKMRVHKLKLIFLLGIGLLLSLPQFAIAQSHKFGPLRDLNPSPIPCLFSCILETKMYLPDDSQWEGGWISGHSSTYKWFITDRIKMVIRDGPSCGSACAELIDGLGGVGYIRGPNPDLGIGTLNITTFYATDSTSSGGDFQFDGIPSSLRDQIIFAEETMFGASGVAYTASSGQWHTIFDLNFLYPEFDLSPFSSGDPTSSVFVFETFMPAAEIGINIPEPSTWFIVIISIFSLFIILRKPPALPG
jgi:hypothetical protein